MPLLPLTGIRVLDLTRVLAGPMCTMLLGDVGAEVIKVERPVRGDDTRDWGPPFDERGESAYYLSVNRNKMSVSADLTVPSERGLVLSLAHDADVVVENFIPGTLERLGLSAARALEENPRLVWCSITGFGAGSRRPGYDFVVQAESGWMAITGEPGGAPMKTGVALSDIVAGKDAAIAILAALVGRDRGAAVDRHIVIALVDSARAALVNVAQNALVAGTAATRWGNAHPNLVPYQLFETQDRAVVVAVGNDDQWLACVRALGVTELERDPDLRTNRGRLAQRTRIVELLQRHLAHLTAAVCIAKLDQARVPCGVVKTVLEAIEDAGNASRLLGMPSSIGGEMRRPPPRLDEHGVLVRRRGWDAFSVTA